MQTKARTLKTAVGGLALWILGGMALAQPSHHVVQVSPQGARFGPAEVSLAINPSDPDNLVAVSLTAAGTSLAYRSQDGGATWQAQAVPNPEARIQADDAVVFGADGVAYHSFIAYQGLFETEAPEHSSGIFVTASHDGGETWQPAVAVIDHADSVRPFEDKPYLRTDRSPDSPRQGNLYISWTRFDEYQSFDPACRSHIYLSRSNDQAGSFSPPVRVSDLGGNCLDDDDTLQGAVPAVGPQGTVYVVWASPQGLLFDRSLDGGQTFGADRVIAANPGGWKIPVPGYFRHNGMPVTGVDNSSGPFRGTIYVNWIDERNGDTDVFLIHSRDGGATWSEPVRVNDDPLGNGRSQFFTWMAVDPQDGSVNVIFYDRRDTQGNLSRLTLARSTDGGLTFDNHPIDLPAFDCSPGLFFGDYTGIDAYGGRVAPIFTHCPERNILAVSSAVLDFNTAPEPRLAALDSAQGFQQDRSVLFDFEGFEPGSRASAILSRWGIRMPSFEGRIPRVAAVLDGQGSISDTFLTVPLAGAASAANGGPAGTGSPPPEPLGKRTSDLVQTNSPTASLILNFEEPVRKAGAILDSSGLGSEVVLRAFDETGLALGEVVFAFAQEPERFVGVESLSAHPIAKLQIDYASSPFLNLDDLTLQFDRVPIFSTCLAQVGNGSSGQGFVLRTLIGAANPWNFPVEGRLKFTDSDGEPLALEIEGVAGSEFDVELSAFGAVERSSSGDALAVGYACLESSAPLQATATFQLFDLEGAALAEAGVESSFGQHLSVASVSRSDSTGLETGIALANPTDQPLEVAIALVQDGETTHFTLIQLPARGHLARFLSQLFPALTEDDLQASIRIAASSPVAVTALRTVNGRLLSSLPVAGTAK
ncbi:MAG TPA: sialidase family protein [Acidobacteriota bacterium]|nr:sialidase family protein [Acidobacteriota bacterium]